jgi:hypothetical protein
LRLLAHAVPSYQAPAATPVVAEQDRDGTAPLWGYGASRRMLAEQS